MQLHPGFTFDDAASIVGYLAELGISHLYCSPVLQAAPGSTHGYDVVDHGRLSDELGGASAYARLCRALADHDMSIVLDIVPNHMALAGAANRWWWDVLEDGPASRFARHFDIVWSATAAGSGPSVLMPVLGDHYGRVLEAGELRLAHTAGSFSVGYHDHELPLSPRSVSDLLRAAAVAADSDELRAIADELEALPPATATATVERHQGKAALQSALRSLTSSRPVVADAIDAELARAEADPDALDELLARQSYRLAHWRTANEELDYRRFFDITTLVGLRAEDPVVFEDTHRLLAELVEAGDVTGLRVDHVDGLRDPAGYLRRLRDRIPGAFVAVEKVLAPDEELPGTWPVVGTSGYDFLERVGELFVDPAGREALARAHRAAVGDERTFAEVARDAKQHVVREELAAETERVADLLGRVCGGRRRHRDHTHRDLRTAVQEAATSLAVYRTYVVPGEPTSVCDRQRLRDAFADVAARRPDLDGELLELFERVLRLDEAGVVEAELAVRFQQLTAPVMAKGVEDTAFYRYTPLLPANEVGSDPGAFGRGVEPFHDHNAAVAARWPGTMLALSTHDTKRSADVRARLSLLSELPEAWSGFAERWTERADRHRHGDRPDAVAVRMLLQTLVGAWPVGADRVEAAMVKAAYEAKVHTSWSAPDPDHEPAVRAFVSAALADPELMGQVEAFLTDHDLVRLGRITSLAQTTLLLTSPGVPDVYQGDELWDLSLVDPDNRRPVDHAQRRALLGELGSVGASAAFARLDDGGAKLWLIHRLLQHRRAAPELYAAQGYRPLPVTGPRSAHAVAFARSAGPTEGSPGDLDPASDGLAVVVPRLVAGLAAAGWGDTELALPEGRWTDVLGGGEWGGVVPLGSLLGELPVAVLERTG